MRNSCSHYYTTPSHSILYHSLPWHLFLFTNTLAPVSCPCSTLPLPLPPTRRSSPLVTWSLKSHDPPLLERDNQTPCYTCCWNISSRSVPSPISSHLISSVLLYFFIAASLLLYLRPIVTLPQLLRHLLLQPCSIQLQPRQYSGR